jgi:hypothetical protein
LPLLLTRPHPAATPGCWLVRLLHHLQLVAHQQQQQQVALRQSGVGLLMLQW